MKRIIFSIVSVCVIATTLAQVKPTTQPIVQKNKNNNNSGGQTPASAPALTDADYFLAVARLTVKTAGDNKEKPSKLILRVYPAAGTDNWRKGYMEEDYTDELKVWSTSNFTLPRMPGFEQSFNSLANYKQTGVMVDILYNTAGNGAFGPLDAWKIQEVSVTLEFKDKNGNPHPAMGSKTIYFTGVYLDYKKWQVFYKTDQYFNALTPVISNRQ